MLDAIDHVALVVRDPSRTAALFEKLFAAKIMRRTDLEGHDETFVRLGGAWFVLVKADVQRERTGDHIAFHVTDASLQSVARKLTELKMEFQWARSNTSLYFFDYDNHVFELDTKDLESDLAGES